MALSKKSIELNLSSLVLTKEILKFEIETMCIKEKKRESSSKDIGSGSNALNVEKGGAQIKEW